MTIMWNSYWSRDRSDFPLCAAPLSNKHEISDVIMTSRFYHVIIKSFPSFGYSTATVSKIGLSRITTITRFNIRSVPNGKISVAMNIVESKTNMQIFTNCSKISDSLSHIICIFETHFIQSFLGCFDSRNLYNMHETTLTQLATNDWLTGRLADWGLATGWQTGLLVIW